MYIKLSEMIIARDIEGPSPGLTGKLLYLDDVAGTLHNYDGTPYENPDPRFYTYSDPEPLAETPLVFIKEINPAQEEQVPEPDSAEDKTINERIVELQAELTTLEAAPDKDMLLKDL